VITQSFREKRAPRRITFATAVASPHWFSVVSGETKGFY